MDQTVPAELRNGSEKKEGAIRKKDPLELEEFLKEWRSRLREPGTGWEGPRAVAELRGKEMFAFLLCEKRSATEWQAEDLFSRILDEMKSYREEARGRLIKQQFGDVDAFLSGLTERIQKKVERNGLRELKSLLKDLRREVAGTRKKVGLLKERKTDWYRGVWHHRWPKILRKNLVSRKLDFDSRLQIELGKMFADYLRPKNVKLETIARLILLAYRVGELAGMDGQVTRTIHTGRVLNVRNIRDKLTYSGLQNAASYKRKRQ